MALSVWSNAEPQATHISRIDEQSGADVWYSRPTWNNISAFMKLHFVLCMLNVRVLEGRTFWSHSRVQCHNAVMFAVLVATEDDSEDCADTREAMAELCAARGRTAVEMMPSTSVNAA